VDYRKAVEISEYGLLKAMSRLRLEPGWDSGFGKTQYNDGYFAVTVTKHNTDTTRLLTIESQGFCGSMVQTHAYELRLAADSAADSQWIEMSRR
jgi:hypothetical protein